MSLQEPKRQGRAEVRRTGAWPGDLSSCVGGGGGGITKPVQPGDKNSSFHGAGEQNTHCCVSLSPLSILVGVGLGRGFLNQLLPGER